MNRHSLPLFSAAKGTMFTRSCVRVVWCVRAAHPATTVSTLRCYCQEGYWQADLLCQRCSNTPGSETALSLVVVIFGTMLCAGLMLARLRSSATPVDPPMENARVHSSADLDEEAAGQQSVSLEMQIVPRALPKEERSKKSMLLEEDRIDEPRRSASARAASAASSTSDHMASIGIVVAMWQISSTMRRSSQLNAAQLGYQELSDSSESAISSMIDMVMSLQPWAAECWLGRDTWSYENKSLLLMVSWIALPFVAGVVLYIMDKLCTCAPASRCARRCKPSGSSLDVAATGGFGVLTFVGASPPAPLTHCAALHTSDSASRRVAEL